MQEIKVEDLEAGDEVLLSCQTSFRYVRILRTPQLGKKLHWKTQAPMYKAVKCSSKTIETSQTHTWGNGHKRTWIETKWILTDKDHNKEFYQNLSDRQIILIKKNNN
jgi:hypothetical protein